jgi:hypothetical protein
MKKVLKKGRLEENVVLEPGDLIIVKESLFWSFVFFFVLVEVFFLLSFLLKKQQRFRPDFWPRCRSLSKDFQGKKMGEKWIDNSRFARCHLCQTVIVFVIDIQYWNYTDNSKIY